MNNKYKSNLGPQDQQVFSFGKKFYGKKLNQILNKKEFVQILKEKGLINYLDPKIINHDMDYLNRFQKGRSQTLKKEPLSPNPIFNSENTSSMKTGPIKTFLRGNQFRNMKNPIKSPSNNEKNYINNILVKPRYHKIPKAHQVLGENHFKNLKSMPNLVFFEENKNFERKNIMTLNYIPSFNDFKNIESDFLNDSKSMNDIIFNEHKEMEEKINYLKNFLGKENKLFKIRNPIKRGTSTDFRGTHVLHNE